MPHNAHDKGLSRSRDSPSEGTPTYPERKQTLCPNDQRPSKSDRGRRAPKPTHVDEHSDAVAVDEGVSLNVQALHRYCRRARQGGQCRERHCQGRHHRWRAYRNDSAASARSSDTVRPSVYRSQTAYGRANVTAMQYCNLMQTVCDQLSEATVLNH